MASKHTSPQALRDPPKAPAPMFQTSSYTPPSPVSHQRAPALHRRTEIPPSRGLWRFYRTLFPSGPLPCLNFSIEKRASNSQQQPLPCCAHFRFPKWLWAVFLSTFTPYEIARRDPPTGSEARRRVLPNLRAVRQARYLVLTVLKTQARHIPTTDILQL